MGKSPPRHRWKLIIWWLGMVAQLSNSQDLEEQKLRQDDGEIASAVQLIHLDNEHVTITNGLVSLTLKTPEGLVTSVTYKGGDNLLETKNEEDDRGYWDVSWNKPGDRSAMDKFAGTSYKIIVQNKDQIEISFTKTWRVGSPGIPLNIDKRYLMVKGSPGFYTYTVLERLKGWPAFLIGEGRIVFKLGDNKFHYMAMSDERQRIMPRSVDRATGQVLDYKEAVLLTHPTNPEFKYEVDDKYFYSSDNKDIKVHGWASSDPHVGFWMITPSNEFRMGGPFKQDLTAHVGPTLLNMFTSTHYVGKDIMIKFETEEYWKKVWGPVFVYLNSDVLAKTNPSILWDDAKQRMEKEVASWPYDFPDLTDFIKSDQRGAVRGRLLVHDRYKNKHPQSAASAYVGLAPPGEAGSWQLENKGYQFWTQTNKHGNFLIKNVIPGNYSLFASVPGIVGDYKYDLDITISPGSNVDVKRVVFEAPRKGETLWEIGIPDRTAAEFFIPDTDPTFKLHQFLKPVEKFRQYGLWKRYTDYYPRTDVVYMVGKSNYTKDWFFAHVTRNVGVRQFEATTWQIVFDLNDVDKGANYTLQLALASASYAHLQVRINDQESHPLFNTRLIGENNAVARHGIRGLYYFYSIGVPGSLLVDGNNTIFLTQANSGGPWAEVMYDYIRFEGPALDH